MRWAGVSGGCHIRQRGVRPRGVVMRDPGADGFPGVIEPEEERFVQQLIAHAAVEGFDEAVLHCPARCSAIRRCCRSTRQEWHWRSARCRDRIRSSRLAAFGDDGGQFTGDPDAGDRGVRDRSQALARHVVDDVEDAEAPVAGELSCTKSSDQRALASASTRIGQRVPTALRRDFRLRTASLSQREAERRSY